MNYQIRPKHRGYKHLLGYQRAEMVYDATCLFVERWVDRGSRTRDQMVQAARSGKQNILEGSVASGISKETEFKLTGVARASLEELLEDYRDFMRLREITEWPPGHPYARRLSSLLRNEPLKYSHVQRAVEHPQAGICSNAIAGITKVTCYLLDRQLAALERDFVEHGGLRERMTQARVQYRSRKRSAGAKRP